MEGGFDRQTVYGKHNVVDKKKSVFQAPVELQWQTTTQKSN